eukprot:1601653-Lingulodinium_polyedra.AAC.1
MASEWPAMASEWPVTGQRMAFKFVASRTVMEGGCTARVARPRERSRRRSPSSRPWWPHQAH